MNDQAVSLELISSQGLSDDSIRSFEPTSLQAYLGQEAIKRNLSIFIQAALMRQEPLDHMLLFGPPGLGKTTLAKVMATELGVPLRITSAPILERSGDLVAILSSLTERELLFFDEIHRLPAHVEEVLYSAMEQFAVDVIIGQGAGAKSIRLPIAPFTLIGATTKTGMISAPLQTRFGIIERLDFYTPEELAQIIQKNASFFMLGLEERAALELARRSRGTPRIAKRLLRRVRDFAAVARLETVDLPLVQEALAQLGIDDQGLTALDLLLLRLITLDFKGGPVGLETLAAISGEDAQTIEEVCEPYLMRLGLLQKSPRGRMIPAHKYPELAKRFDLLLSSQEQSSFL